MNIKVQSPVSILMVGIGGYGYYYLKTLLEEFPEGAVRLAGIVDPLADKSGHGETIRRLSIRVYSEIEDFYRNERTPDLAVISSPIHFHVQQSLVALKHGSNVLCDKPLAAIVQDVDDLIRLRNSSGKWLMVGYQWSYSRAIQALKRDMLSGRFGKPLKAQSLCLWPRDDAYYNRNSWAGKIRDNEGHWVLDSPANNGMAHFLHNLLYLLGDQVNVSANPVEATAELYRVNPVENYDTIASRILTDSGVEILYYASHATHQNVDPVFRIEFEEATVTFRDSEPEIIARTTKGETFNYGSPENDHQFKKLFDAVECIRNPQEIICGAEAARAQTLCINGIQESVTEISDFPSGMIKRDNLQGRWWVDGLGEAFLDCYNKKKLPSEAGYNWTISGKSVNLTDYIRFTGSKG